MKERIDRERLCVRTMGVALVSSLVASDIDSYLCVSHMCTILHTTNKNTRERERDVQHSQSGAHTANFHQIPSVTDTH
jgi:hypothetical protein